MTYIKALNTVRQTIEVSKDAELQASRDIIRRLRCRKLYRFLDEYLVPSDLIAKIPQVSVR